MRCNDGAGTSAKLNASLWLAGCCAWELLKKLPHAAPTRARTKTKDGQSDVARLGKRGKNDDVRATNRCCWGLGTGSEEGGGRRAKQRAEHFDNTQRLSLRGIERTSQPELMCWGFKVFFRVIANLFGRIFADTWDASYGMCALCSCSSDPGAVNDPCPTSPDRNGEYGDFEEARTLIECRRGDFSPEKFKFLTPNASKQQQHPLCTGFDSQGWRNFSSVHSSSGIFYSCCSI